MPSSEPAKLRAIGVLVAFDTLRDPFAGIDDVLAVIDHVMVVDNTSEGHPALVSIVGKPRVSVIDNRNVGGLAGAYNAALSRIDTDHPQATHVLFLDDDTDTGALDAFLASDVTRDAASRSDVAAVAPAYVDRETGLRGTHIRLHALYYEVVPREVRQPTSVSFLINSMSLWRLDAIRRIGTYNTKLKVDHVDTDYCLRAAAENFILILNPMVTFVHSIGKRKKYRIMGKTLQSGGHNSQRREMIARNTILLARHYLGRFPSFTVLCFVRIVYEVLGIVMAENNRLSKLLAITKGVVIGLVTRYA